MRGIGAVAALVALLAGQRHSRELRIAHVWVKREGRWRLTYTQLTRLAA
jgi:hypothetical protein